MPFFKFICMLCLGAISWLPIYSRLSDNPEFDATIRQNLEKTLTLCGIDFKSNDRLLDALVSSDDRTHIPALELLVDRQEKRAIPLLQSQLSKIDTLHDYNNIARFNMFKICQALSDLGDISGPWKAGCIALMTNPHNSDETDYAIFAAGLLAQHGDGSGWPIIRDEFLKTQDDSILYSIGSILTLFDGLKYEEDGSIKIINLADTCLSVAKLNFHRLDISLMALDKVAKPKHINAIRELQVEYPINNILTDIIDHLLATMHHVLFPNPDEKPK